MMPCPVQSCSCSHHTHLSGLSFCVSSCAFYISKNDVLFCLLTPFFFLSLVPRYSVELLCSSDSADNASLFFQ